MDRQLIWTERAAADVESIVRYISRHNPEAAARVANGIYERAQILLQNPEAGTILEELRVGGWRKLIHLNWKIVYTVRCKQIIIGRVWPLRERQGRFSNPTLMRSILQTIRSAG